MLGGKGSLEKWTEVVLEISRDYPWIGRAPERYADGR